MTKYVLIEGTGEGRRNKGGFVQNTRLRRSLHSQGKAKLVEDLA
jgi:hypothetical protein